MINAPELSVWSHYCVFHHEARHTMLDHCPDCGKSRAPSATVSRNMPTPRTDVMVAVSPMNVVGCAIDLCRTLERELAERTSQLAERTSQLAEMTHTSRNNECAARMLAEANDILRNRP